MKDIVCGYIIIVLKNIVIIWARMNSEGFLWWESERICLYIV